MYTLMTNILVNFITNQIKHTYIMVHTLF